MPALSRIPVAASLALVISMLVTTETRAERCEARFDIITEANHGNLQKGARLKGLILYDEGRRLRMGSETTSYLATGDMRVTAPDGSGVTGTIRAIHLVRTPHFADYVSFDAKNVQGDLGGISDYEDPMLVTLFAPRGSLRSFDLPKDTDGWKALRRRQVFQVHTPDTMWTLPGQILNFESQCQTQ